MRGKREPRGLIDRNTKSIAGKNYAGDPAGVVRPWGSGPSGATDTPVLGNAPLLTIPIDVENGDDGVKAIASTMAKRGAKGWRRAIDSVASRVRGQLMTLANWSALFSAILGGLRSFKALVVDGIGGVVLAARVATSALFRAQSSDGLTRSLVDYLGFRAGPVLEKQIDWSSVPQQAITAPVSTAYIGGCQLVISANGRASFNGSAGQGSTPNGSWATGSYILALQAARANGDKIYLFHQPNWDAYTGVSLYDKTIYVLEWAMCPHGTLANTDFYVGILGYAFSAPWAAGQIKAGVRFHQSAGDTHYMLTSSDGTTESAIDTTVAPVVGTIVRCRLEFHKAGSPFGAGLRFFMNGTLITKATNLPYSNLTPIDGVFALYTEATGAGAESGIEVGPARMLATLYGGGLDASLATSDV